MKNMSISEKIATKVEKSAVKLVEGTVGKSIPIFLHEVKVPDEIKNRMNNK